MTPKVFTTWKQRYDQVEKRRPVANTPRESRHRIAPPRHEKHHHRFASRIVLGLSSRQQLWTLLAVVGIVRLLTIGLYPLTDATEARYAEIARKMLETGQWIVPQIDYGVPFWGKPPLSMWMTAISYKLIGVTEFAARIPSLLMGVAVCALTYVLALRRRGINHGLRASIVVATSLLMMVSAGTVMTDPAMVLGTTLSMVGFWLALTDRSRSWGYLFFLGLAIGLLAKGPVAALLTLAPIGVWVLVCGHAKASWNNIPWITGALLTAALVVPWYWAAEMQSPGFLNYFLVGEHWQRYTVSGWKGDLYGAGHAHPFGTIWLYALLGTLPWSPWLIWQLARGRAVLAVTPLRSGDGWTLYLLCWLLAPIVFFSLARNILPTYVLPGLVAFGLLVGEAWAQRHSQDPSNRILALGIVTPALTVLLVLVWPSAGVRSQKEVVSAYRNSLQQEVALVYYKARPDSAAFYSAGSAREIEREEQLRLYLAGATPTYVVTKGAAYAALPDDIKLSLTNVMTSQTGERMLLRHEPIMQSAELLGPVSRVVSARPDLDRPRIPDLPGVTP